MKKMDMREATWEIQNAHKTVDAISTPYCIVTDDAFGIVEDDPYGSYRSYRFTNAKSDIYNALASYHMAKQTTMSWMWYTKEEMVEAINHLKDEGIITIGLETEMFIAKENKNV